MIFEGVKIADFSWVAVGPRSTMYLAELGATVIRIESTTHPDTLRTAGPFKDNKPGLNRSAFYARYNLNKFSVTLNLNHPKGPEVAKRFVKWADVVADAFPPGVMKKWGLSYEDIRKIKPDIIMFSTNNQGQTGPHASHPGYGVQLASLSGFTYLTGWPDRDPAGLYGAYTDFIAPHFIASALSAALIWREKTGEGVYMDFSQYECGIQFLGPVILDWEANRKIWTRMGNRVGYACPHGAFRCRGDDEWITISVSSDEEWEALKKCMGYPEWTRDERFRTFLGRKRNEDELERLIEEWTIKFDKKELMEILQREGVPSGGVWKTSDVYDDPQLKWRKHFVDIEHPEIGRYPVEVSPFVFQKTPIEIKRPAPCIGEHNYYVYTQILGMSDEEFLSLLEEGVFE